ncbi:MAG: FAD-dependent oxidoreductase [Rhodospirillales bacterium]|nr:FAD-dependent oxidoreductase [Rhodospirillales bacterium]
MTGVLVVGGGFAGLWAALAAARVADESGATLGIALVSPDDHLTMRPRLYEPYPERLREPLRPILDAAGVRFIGGAVTDIDATRATIGVTMSDGREERLAYGRLVLAAGSELRPLPVPGAADHAWNIDSYAAAIALDRHLHAMAHTPDDPGHDTVAIIGAGFTGIELATEMRARFAAHGRPDAASRVRVVLIEQADAVGPELGGGPRPAIEAALRAANVEIRLGARVAHIEAGGLALANGERLRAATVVVTSGLRANPLVRTLGLPTDDLGRLPVDDNLHVLGIDGILAAGDVARARVDDDGHIALMSCQHAIRMGRVAGDNAACGLLGRSLRPYRQPSYVTCLDLGAAGAVFTKGWGRTVQHVGDAAKRLKRTINTQRIYPPRGTRAEILAAAAPDASPSPASAPDGKTAIRA